MKISPIWILLAGVSSAALGQTSTAPTPNSSPPKSSASETPAGATGAKPTADSSESVVVAVTLPTSGSYLILTEDPASPGKPLTPPASVNGPKAALELPLSAKALGKVALSPLDSSSQTMARKTVDVKAGAASVTFGKADFDRVASLPVQVTSGGKAVQSALVTLMGPDGAALGEEQLLPGEGGIVTFRGVPSGKDTVKVTYNDNQTATQEINVDAATPPAQRKAEVTVAGPPATEPLKPMPGGTPTAGSAEKPATSNAKPSGKNAPTPESDNGVLGFVTTLAILALLGGGGYVYFKNHPETFQNLLGKLPLPEEEEPVPLRKPEPPPVNVPPGTCPFCGAAKDPVTGACACALPAGGGASAFPTAATGSGPRLVALSGSVAGQTFPLEDNGLSLGRESVNDVALTGDQTASRRHATVARSNGNFSVRDEGSSNGTFVNGTRVEEAPIHPGDELVVGQTRFRFEA